MEDGVSSRASQGEEGLLDDQYEYIACLCQAADDVDGRGVDQRGSGGPGGQEV